MSLDERIQKLSETIIHEVRSPIEAALHTLLEDVMRLAGEDRDRAVQSAAAAAVAEHEATIAALRETHEREHDEKLTALCTQLAIEHEAALAAAAAEHEATIAAIRESHEREHEEKLAAVRTELTTEREAALAELTAGHDAQTATLRQQLDDDRAAAVGSALASARAQSDEERDQALVTLRAELDRERDSALAQLRDDLARESAAALRAARDEAARESEAVQAARDEAAHAHYSALDHEMAQVRADATQAREERAQAEQTRLATEQDLGAALVVEREHELACSDRTLAAFRQLDDARSLTGVLRILADEAATEIGRVAVLLVVDSRLRGWELRGLPTADASAIDAPVVAGTVFGRAIATGLPASTSEAPLGSGDDALAALLSAPPGRAGLAVPVTVGGRVVAILYGDDAADRTPVVPSNWPEVAEILARHAGHCLELLTISHASALAGRVQQEPAAPAFRPSGTSPFADDRREEDSARRYARLLISEIKLYNEAAVEQGRSERNLLGRLGPDVERARRLYEDKIPAAIRQRVDCFDQELVRTLAGGDPGLLGQA